MLGVGRGRQRRIAVHERGAVVRGEQPLVRVDAEAVGALEAEAQRFGRGRAQRRAAVGRVDVQPEVELGADVGDGVELVDGTDVGRAEVADDGEHPVGTVLGDRGPQRRRRSSGHDRRAARRARRHPSPWPRRGRRRASRRWRRSTTVADGSPWRRRAWCRAVTSADRLAAEPPLTKQPPAPSGKPASPASHSSVSFSAAMAPAPASHIPPKMLEALTTRSNMLAAGVGAVAT